MNYTKIIKTSRQGTRILSMSFNEPMTKRLKMGNEDEKRHEIQNFDLYASKHTVLMDNIGADFSHAYTTWLIRELAARPHPLHPVGGRSGIEMNQKMQNDVYTPLYQYAKEELGMDNATMERADAYMTRPDMRSDDVDDLVKKVVDMGVAKRQQQQMQPQQMPTQTIQRTIFDY